MSAYPGHENLTSAEIEQEIDNAFLRLSTAAPEDSEGRRVAWEDLKYFKAMRKPEEVERIERERGLR